MNAGTVLRFQFGKEEAIWAVARSKAGFWCGMILVLITAIPRNYDQLYIGESSLRWIFGPLGFSLISGTWIFLVAYVTGASNGIRRAGNKRESQGAEWMSFMGLFWMTAPIAWLYAIPVERFLDSTAAAQANVWLLAIVATWRVVLMTRVLQVVCDWGYWQALSFVLVAASAEVFVLGFFGGAFSQQLMAGMAGMRMSQAEDVISSAFVGAMILSVPVFLLSLVVALTVGIRGNLKGLPERKESRMPWKFLSLATVFWLVVAVWPQWQVYQNARLEGLVAEERYGEALVMMGSKKRSDFVPSRELPPKAYESSVYDELPAMIAAAGADTEPWVWEHLLEKMDVMMTHLESEVPWRPHGLGLHWSDLLKNLAKVEAGREWINEHKLAIAFKLQDRVRSGIRSEERPDDFEDKKALSMLENDWGVPPQPPADPE
jgi:hypothetical protein